MLIRSDLVGEELIEVFIHECLHAGDWTKDEEWVDQTARDIARGLWKLIQEGRIRGEDQA
jgi:hypothetical protein